MLTLPAWVLTGSQPGGDAGGPSGQGIRRAGVLTHGNASVCMHPSCKPGRQGRCGVVSNVSRTVGGLCNPNNINCSHDFNDKVGDAEAFKSMYSHWEESPLPPQWEGYGLTWLGPSCAKCYITPLTLF